MGYNRAKKKMKKMIASVLFLMGMGTCLFAQNNCPTGYKEVPGTNNNHTGKIVTQSQCTTTTTTNNSGQNNWNGNAGGKAGVGVVSGSVGGGYERKGETNSQSTQTQQCTDEKTYYYRCEPDNKKGKKD